MTAKAKQVYVVYGSTWSECGDLHGRSHCVGVYSTMERAVRAAIRSEGNYNFRWVDKKDFPQYHKAYESAKKIKGDPAAVFKRWQELSEEIRGRETDSVSNDIDTVVLDRIPRERKDSDGSDSTFVD